MRKTIAIFFAFCLITLLSSCVTYYRSYVYKAQIVSELVNPVDVFDIVDRWVENKRAGATKYEAYEIRIKNKLDFIIDIEVRERIASIKGSSFFLTHSVFVEVEDNRVLVSIDPLGSYEIPNTTKRVLKEEVSGQMTFSTDVVQYENIDFFDRKIYYDSAPRKFIRNIETLEFYTTELGEDFVSYMKSRLRIL